MVHANTTQVLEYTESYTADKGTVLVKARNATEHTPGPSFQATYSAAIVLNVYISDVSIVLVIRLCSVDLILYT